MRRRKLAFTIVELFVVIAIIVTLYLLFFQHGDGRYRDIARQLTCRSTLKQIGVALQEFCAVHGDFPPAYTIDPDGKRLHSWRTLLLPYLDQQALYDSIDLTKPWDDPVNVIARETEVWFYACPGAVIPGVEFDGSKTTYLALVGPGWAFAGAEPRARDAIEDGAANTLAVIDVGADRAVHWMSPEDISAEIHFDPQIEGNHPGVHNVLYLNGDYGELSPDTSHDEFTAMLTIASGESVGSMDAAADDASPSDPQS